MFRESVHTTPQRASGLIAPFRGTAEAWHREDFEPARRAPRSIAADFWFPEFVDARPSRPSAEADGGWGDPWDPAPLVRAARPDQARPGEARQTTSVGTWFDDAALPDFDPRAGTSPFVLPSAAPREDDSVRRARWLVDILDIPSPRERRRWGRRFEELFDEFPQSKTFEALSGLALNGATPADLCEAGEFRRLWLATPAWWSVRGRGGSKPFPGRGTSLGWARIHRWLVRAGSVSAAELIRPEWLEEWLGLPPGPGYWRFADYVEMRLGSPASMPVTDDTAPVGRSAPGEEFGIGSPARTSELFHQTGSGLPAAYLHENLAYAADAGRR